MSRNLTQNEISLAKTVYQHSIDYGKVKIHDGKYFRGQPMNSGMTPNGEIHISDDKTDHMIVYSDDYGQDFRGDDNNRLKTFFIHEMAHVWQYQNKILTLGVIGSALWTQITYKLDYKSAYPYTLRDDASLISDYNLEQQASIITDYFRVIKRGWGFSDRIQNAEPLTRKRQMLTRVMGDFVADPTYAVR